jgi:hypothetical protein
MSNTELYVTDMGDQSIDVSSATRKGEIQTSVIIKQDASKSGILSFLEEVEQEVAPPPTRQAPATMRPTGGSSSGGSYP